MIAKSYDLMPQMDQHISKIVEIVFKNNPQIEKIFIIFCTFLFLLISVNNSLNLSSISLFLAGVKQLIVDCFLNGVFWKGLKFCY